jgi:hypothetical protein
VCRPAPAKCAGSCEVDAGETDCSGSCVNIESNPLHCGDCSTKCNDTTNGVGVCNAKKCGIKCNTGYVECTPGACAPEKIFYRDADNDGFGDSTKSVKGCAAPNGYVAVGGDCNDGNPNVFPGQTRYFATGYAVGSTVSFDYNCDGVETPQVGFTKFVGCAADCSASGYNLPQPTRQGPGIEPFCGSATTSSCSGGVAAERLAAQPIQLDAAESLCSTTSQAAPPINCR